MLMRMRETPGLALLSDNSYDYLMTIYNYV